VLGLSCDYGIDCRCKNAFKHISSQTHIKANVLY
jgi:hypothetical protein